MCLSEFGVRAWQAFGGFIMSASHNPGGPKCDWGIKVGYVKLRGHKVCTT